MCLHPCRLWAPSHSATSHGKPHGREFMAWIPASLGPAVSAPVWHGLCLGPQVFTCCIINHSLCTSFPKFPLIFQIMVADRLFEFRDPFYSERFFSSFSANGTRSTLQIRGRALRNVFNDIQSSVNTQDNIAFICNTTRSFWCVYWSAIWQKLTKRKLN